MSSSRRASEDSQSDLISAARREVEAVSAEIPLGAFPGYRLVEEVHRGTQGVVYRALQQSTGQTVALKVLRAGASAGDEDRARFEREVAILAQLRHPNIVSIHDTGSSASGVFFVMDYIEGQALDAYVAGRQLSVEEALRLFGKIADAVHNAHLRGVIHRDLKPGNILIDGRGEPHVLDFGLAKVSEDELSAMTMTGQFVGSVPWSAPEQAEGDQARIDVRTDVYALGVILFQMLTGRFPYEVTGNLRDVLDRIGSHAPARPRSLRSDLDDEVETIVLTCLAKEPERRYQSAGELARDVAAYLEGDPIQAKRDSTWYVVCKQVQRHRFLVATAAGFLLMLTAGFIVCFAFWRDADRAWRVAEKARGVAEQARAAAEEEAGEAQRVRDFYEGVLGTIHPDPVLLTTPVSSEETRRELQETPIAFLLENASARIEDSFADEPMLAAEVREAVGRGFSGLGFFDRARGEHERAWETRRRMLGEDDARTLQSASLFAEALAFDGDDAEAEAMLPALIVKLEQELGSDAPYTLRAREALGHVVCRQGRIDEGVEILVNVHEKARRAPHVDESRAVATAIAPAYWMSVSGRWSEAEDILRPSYEAAFEILGPDHAITMASDRALERVASVEQVTTASTVFKRFRTEGDGAGARELAERAWALSVETDALEEAEQLAREALVIARDTLGRDHIDTLLCEQILGVVLHRSGRPADGARLVVGLDERARQQTSPTDSRLWVFHWVHSRALREVSRADAADDVLTRACEGLLRTLGPKDDLSRRAVKELAARAESRGDEAGARHWRERLTLD